MDMILCNDREGERAREGEWEVVCVCEHPVRLTSVLDNVMSSYKNAVLRYGYVG